MAMYGPLGHALHTHRGSDMRGSKVSQIKARWQTKATCCTSKTQRRLGQPMTFYFPFENSEISNIVQSNLAEVGDSLHSLPAYASWWLHCDRVERLLPWLIKDGSRGWTSCFARPWGCGHLWGVRLVSSPLICSFSCWWVEVSWVSLPDQSPWQLMNFKHTLEMKQTSGDTQGPIVHCEAMRDI